MCDLRYQSRVTPLALLVVVAVLAGVAEAQTVRVDFDDRDAPSCVFSGAERIADQWAASGVTFMTASPPLAGAIVKQTCSGFELVRGHSPPNLVAYVPGLTELPTTMLFDPEVSSVSLLATNWSRVATITLTASHPLPASQGRWRNVG